MNTVPANTVPANTADPDSLEPIDAQFAAATPSPSRHEPIADRTNIIPFHVEQPTWLVDYGDMTYLVRGNQLLGSYWQDEVSFAIVDHIARQLTHRVRHADGSSLFRDRLGNEPDSEGILLSEWLTSEGAALLEPYEMPLEDQP